MIAMKIVGYDHNTESLAVTVPVPADAVGAARVIANVPGADPDLIGAYPLTKDQVLQIAAVAQIAIEPGRVRLLSRSRRWLRFTAKAGV